jgi:hypothetical protein
VRDEPPDPARRLHRTIQTLADALQAAILVAEELGRHVELTAHDALALTLRLRRASRVLHQLRPKGGRP